MAKFKPTPIPLENVNPEDRSLWVVNTTKKPANGDVFFTVPKTRGSGVDDVQVIKSWAAQNLCEQVSVPQLLDSNEFRKMLSFGNLMIVSAADAAKINNDQTKDFGDESRRIMNRRQRVLDGSSFGNSPVFQSAGGSSDSPESRVDMKVRALMEPVKNGDDDVDEAQIINTLRTMENDDDLGKDEARYIQKIAKGAGKKKLVRYANNVLKSLEDEDEDEE